MLIKPFSKLAKSTARLALRTIKSNRALYNLVYDAANEQEFSDLYEHEKMLADSVRVDTYAEAIRRLIKPADVVVDLGTGSGILSMLAAKQGAKVYALDHSEFITVAEKIARHNGIDTIQFVRTMSTQFDCPEKVDVILHEQIGDDLFNENMIENLLDLKRRMLKPGGRILPGKFELFLEPVCLKNDYNVPFVWDITAQGLKFDLLRHLPEAEQYKSPKHGRRSIENAGVEFVLSDPQPIVTVDLNTMSHFDDVAASFNAVREVVRGGRMDGLLQYFRIVFDQQTAFDTHPHHTKTHWGNRLFRMPAKAYEAGEKIAYTLDVQSLRHSQTWSVKLDDAASRWRKNEVTGAHSV